ncbi:mitochondrial ppr repeat protein ppr2 [Gigaspora margarita]|uniref:Mitochondrial ppr repeat protein ppr2 n=1 Tax=Gigaspora margarita TaxID=4874 RepID=A0A8H4APZ7_GIGMA|nr:mitochondrial ppr repeat protein ppr2 [Gigaspora margarita]
MLTRFSRCTINSAKALSVYRFSRAFSLTSQINRTRIPIKEIDTKLVIPEDPYILAEWVRKFGEANQLDDAISVVWNAKKNAQSEVVWNHLIIECVKNRKFQMAFRMFNEMKKHGFVPNEQSFTILLNGLADHRPFVDNILQARKMIDNMQDLTKAKPVELNVIHVNCLLKLCSRLNNFEALQENFNDMMRVGNWAPNKETFTIIFNACARNGEKGYLMAIQLWNQLNSLISKKKKRQSQVRESDGYGADFAPNSGYEIEMDDELVRSMLLVCNKTKNYDKGFEILQNVYGFSISSEISGKKTPSKLSNKHLISPKSVDIMLNLCIGARQYEKGIMLYDETLSQFPDITLDIHNFNKLIICYNQLGQFTKSINTFSPIHARGLEPTLETYDLLLTACRITEDWKSGKEFFELIIKQKKEISLDSHLLNMILELSMLNRKSEGSPEKVRWTLEQIESLGPRYPEKIRNLAKTNKPNTSKFGNASSIPLYNIYDIRYLKRIILAYETVLDPKFINKIDEKQKLQWKENLEFYKTVLAEHEGRYQKSDESIPPERRYDMRSAWRHIDKFKSRKTNRKYTRIFDNNVRSEKQFSVIEEDPNNLKGINKKQN